jgi:hypothetical protein
MYRYYVGHIEVNVADPDPHQSEKMDPDPHQIEKQGPYPHQSEKVKALKGYFEASEGPNLEKVSGLIRIWIRIKLKGRILIRVRICNRVKGTGRIRI